MVYLTYEIQSNKIWSRWKWNKSIGTSSARITEKIENEGIEFVRVKPIQKKIFEIKSNELRSLFKYKEGQIIVVGVVFVKKTQKTPKEKIKLAETRLKEV